MKEILAKAKFGDRFKTRDGQMAILLMRMTTLKGYIFAVDGNCHIMYHEDGTHEFSKEWKCYKGYDIVGKWEDSE